MTTKLQNSITECIREYRNELLEEKANLQEILRRTTNKVVQEHVKTKLCGISDELKKLPPIEEETVHFLRDMEHGILCAIIHDD